MSFGSGGPSKVADSMENASLRAEVERLRAEVSEHESRANRWMVSAKHTEARLAQVAGEIPLLASLAMDRTTDYEKFIGGIVDRLRAAAQPEEE